MLSVLQNVCPAGVATIMGGQKGGFAERIRANAALAQLIPKEIDPAEAAPLLCAGVTVWGAHQPLRHPAWHEGISFELSCYSV